MGGHRDPPWTPPECAAAGEHPPHPSPGSSNQQSHDPVIPLLGADDKESKAGVQTHTGHTHSEQHCPQQPEGGGSPGSHQRASESTPCGPSTGECYPARSGNIRTQPVTWAKPERIQRLTALQDHTCVPPFIPDTRNRRSHTGREQSLAAGAGGGLGPLVRRVLCGDGKLRNQR